MTGDLALGTDGHVTDREGDFLDEVKVSCQKFYPGRASRR